MGPCALTFKKALLRNQHGFALISIIAVLIIICILAVIELPKYLSPDKDKEMIREVTRNTDIVVSKNDTLPDVARNMAGKAALDAATANVQMAHAKLQIDHTSGAVSGEDVVNLLNADYTVVGDYVVSYTVSDPNKVTATLQANSKGKFGTPNSKIITLR